MINICHVSFADGRAGAYAAALRLHGALRALAVDSRVLVARTTSAEPYVVGGRNARERILLRSGLLLDQFPARLYPRRIRSATFSSGWVSGALPARIAALAPDIVHLHWANGLAAIDDLAQLKCPLLWTLHDMWPFSGGCHYSGACRRFVSGCGACPQLGSARWADLARLVWARKARAWAALDLTLVAPSRWMGDQARCSALFATQRIEVIPNGIDLATFHPILQAEARARLGLPLTARLLLFGGMRADADPRKGGDLLAAALARLAAQGETGGIELVTFGSAASPHDISGLPVHSLGMIDDDARLALAYSAADLFIAPSREDNLPNTVIEALACATPCLAFAIGGMPDLIEHERCGYLAQPYDTADLAHGITWLLADEQRRRTLAAAARAKAVAAYDERQQARRYLELYLEVRSEKSEV